MIKEYVRENLNETKTMYQAYNEAVIELAKENDRIVLLYADFPSDIAGEFFRKEYPTRIYDFGIAEANMITAAAGLASCGKIPFTHCHGIFALGRAYNQIRQNIAYDKHNVKIVLCNSGMLWPFMGGSHQVIEDIAALRAIPNIVIFSPADAVETKKVVKAAAEYIGPVAIRLANPPAPIIYKDDYPFELGRATLLRDGDDITIFATGILVSEALMASNILAKENMSVRLYDVHTIKPIDVNTIVKAAQETGLIITVEDGNILGGLGGAISEIVTEFYPVPVKRIGVKDVFGQSGTVDELKTLYGLSASHIVETVKSSLKIRK
ncbi:MAG: transketolase family protein [Nitrososphaeria archaeon]